MGAPMPTPSPSKLTPPPGALPLLGESFVVVVVVVVIASRASTPVGVCACVCGGLGAGVFTCVRCVCVCVCGSVMVTSSIDCIHALHPRASSFQQLALHSVKPPCAYMERAAFILIATV